MKQEKADAIFHALGGTGSYSRNDSTMT